MLADQNALIFTSGMYLVYNFQTELVIYDGYLHVAFKTWQADTHIVGIKGKNGVVIKLELQRGRLVLEFNFKASVRKQIRDIQHPNNAQGKFNDNQRHIICIHHSKYYMYVDVLDDISNPIKHTILIMRPSTAPVALVPIMINVGTRLVGCITGLKYHDAPVNGLTSLNIDFTQLLKTGSSSLSSSTPAPSIGSCGSSLPDPAPFPRYKRRGCFGSHFGIV